MAQKFTDIGNARFDDQRQVMTKIEQDDNCPFCWENLEKYHKQPIIERGEHWLVTTNQWPYDYTKFHFLFIAKAHVCHLTELPNGAGDELIAMSKKICLDHHIPGGALAMRFGDTNYSAGTVKHLHAQLIQPDIHADGYEPVRLKIGMSRK